MRGDSRDGYNSCMKIASKEVGVLCRSHRGAVDSVLVEEVRGEGGRGLVRVRRLSAIAMSADVRLSVARHADVEPRHCRRAVLPDALVAMKPHLDNDGKEKRVSLMYQSVEC
jgi:hypothetical protein